MRKKEYKYNWSDKSILLSILIIKKKHVKTTRILTIKKIFFTVVALIDKESVSLKK